MDAAAHLDSIHLRHNQIHHHAIERALRDPFQPLFGAGRCCHFVPFAVESFGQAFEVGGAVVDGQEARAAKVSLLRRQHRGSLARIAQQRTDTQQEDFGCDGFSEVVVGAAVQPGRLAGGGLIRGQHQDRDAASIHVQSHFPA